MAPLTFLDLGPDIISSNIFPLLSLRDITAVAQTCSVSHSLVNDPVVWQAMYRNVFGSQPSPLSVTAAKWPDLFRRRAQSGLVTWGRPDSGRLGALVRDIPDTYTAGRHYVTAVCKPFPIEAFAKVVIADVTAGGFSFQVLTSDGAIYSTGSTWNGWNFGPGSQVVDFQSQMGTSAQAQGPTQPATPTPSLSNVLFRGNPFPMGRIGGVLRRWVGAPEDRPDWARSGPESPTEVAQPQPGSTPTALGAGLVSGVTPVADVPQPQPGPTPRVPSPTASPLEGTTAQDGLPPGVIGMTFTRSERPSAPSPLGAPLVTAPPVTAKAPTLLTKDTSPVVCSPGVVSRMNTPANAVFVALSSGRCHFIALDTTGSLWTWDHPAQKHGVRIRLVDPLGKPLTQLVLKIEAGWNVSTAYVYGVGIVVWHLRDPVPDPSPEAMGTAAEYTTNALYRVIPGTGAIRGDDHVVDFVAGDGFVVYLTVKGDLYRVDVSDPGLALRGELLSEFMALLGKGARFMRLSGSFRNFVAISSDDQVLMGSKDETAPRVIPSLQNRGLISVAVGDWHYLGLLLDGTLFSWGAESSECGCLGLGSPQEAAALGARLADGRVVVESPQVVDLKGRKALAIAAGGWQSAAIVSSI